jgi:pyridoxal 5'-phosphate synthase pdxS subunit
MSILKCFPNVEPVDVRTAEDLASIDALILPGGESTTIGAVIGRRGLIKALQDFVRTKPVWGVCAGMILLADQALNTQKGQALVGGLRVEVSRNHFGRQSKSSLRCMELSTSLSGRVSQMSHFIRAPAVTSVGEGVEVLARVDGLAVAVQQGHILATAFHPEITNDPSWTSYFLNSVVGTRNVVPLEALQKQSSGQILSASMASAVAPSMSMTGEILGIAPLDPPAEPVYGSTSVKWGFMRFLQGGVIMDVVNGEQAKIAEAAGACSVMALERIPADIRAEGGIARMSDPKLIKEVMNSCTVPVMAKARIGHFAEARVLEALDVDCIDESEVLTMADEIHHINKSKFTIPFVCGAKDLGEALRRIGEGAAMIRLKGDAGTGNVLHAVRHARSVFSQIRALQHMDEDEVYVFAKDNKSPLPLVQLTRKLGRLPVVTFAAGGVATPADVMMLMELGCDGVFVGSGIFKGDDPAKRARAMVEACSYWRRPDIVAEVSEDLGKAMVGLLDAGETYTLANHQDAKL